MTNRYLVQIGEQQSATLAALATDTEERGSEALHDLLEDGPPEFEVIPPPDGGPDVAGTLVVRGELLVWTEQLGDEDGLGGVLEVLRDNGFVVGSVQPATERVSRVRLVESDGDAVPAADLVRAMDHVRRAGFRVSFNHVLCNNAGINPLTVNMTVKSVVPPQALQNYEIPRRPPRPWWTHLPRLPWPFSRCVPRPGDVLVAVVDTGVAYHRDRPGGRREDGWLVDVAGDDDPDTQNLQPDTPLEPGAGHGTATAGLIQIMAPFARVKSYRALTFRGIGSEVAVADAIRAAAEDGADIINLSLGGPALPEHAPLAIEDVLSQLADHVLVVAAAGNARSDAPHFPAGFRSVIAVAATDFDGERAEYSNAGYWVNFSTYGTYATTYVHGTPPGGDPVGEGGDPSAIATGTSMAAPVVSGRLAALLGQGMTPTEAVEALAASGEPRPDLGIFVRLLEQDS
jgi:hypothetical protein